MIKIFEKYKENIIEYWLPVFLWMAIIFSFSSNQVSGTSQVVVKDFLVKKSAHLVEYALLSILCYRALVKSGLNNFKSIALSILISGLFAISDEFHQSTVPGRESTTRDIIIDIIGAVTGLLVFKKIGPVLKERLKI